MTPADAVEIHRAAMEDWIAGRRSWTNLGPEVPYTPDVIAVLDAQEVAKHAEAIRAYGALIGTGVDIPDATEPSHAGDDDAD